VHPDQSERGELEPQPPLIDERGPVFMTEQLR